MYIVEQSRAATGEVILSGSKNAALPILVAACLCEEEVTLHNVPLELLDVKIMLEILREAGFCIEQCRNNTLKYYPQESRHLNTTISEKGSRIRYSLLLLSLFMQKCGQARITKPGGCNFGERKYDIHIDSLTKMGACINEDERYIYGRIDRTFIGQNLLFHTATTSGTENVIIAGVKARGRTIIRNAHTCPEVLDLIHFLNTVGARINYKARYVEVEGVQRLGGGEYTIMNDKDEAMTYMVLAAITRGKITIKNFDFHLVPSEVNLLRQIGVHVEHHKLSENAGDTVIDATSEELYPFHLSTAPYPGIVDAQPLFAALAMSIEGETVITEMRHVGRFQYVEEFKKLGADIEHYHNCIVVNGGKPLTGARVTAHDLRAGAALLLAGSIAQGKTVIENEAQIQRGYCNIVQKMNTLGCRVIHKP